MSYFLLSSENVEDNEMVVRSGAACAVCLAPARLLRVCWRVDETDLSMAEGYECAVGFMVEAYAVVTAWMDDQGFVFVVPEDLACGDMYCE